MTFDQSMWGKLDNSFSQATQQIFSYVNVSDTIATITASGYFDDMAAVLKKYDLVFIQGSDNDEWAKVTSETAATTVTVASVSLIDKAANVMGASTKDSYNKICGYLKVDVRPSGGTSNDYAEQIRSESAKTSGTHWGLDCETHMKADGTASLRSAQGVAVLDTGYTATGATYIGTYGQARADGTFTGSGFLVGLYGLIEASAAITASHVCSAWLDSHQAEAVTGSHQLLYMTNNGAATMDEAIYVYAGHRITSLLSLNTADGMVSATAETGGTSKKIKITLDGVVHYINAYTG